jgi:RNA polymerase sigma factor (sigma-70 family)
MDEADDAAVVRASLDDPARFGTIFDRHHGAIWTHLARTGGRELADDLAGQVFVIGFDRRATYDGSKGSVRAWLFGIAGNLVRTARRTDRRGERARRRIGIAPAAGDPGDDVARAVDAPDRFRRVLDALDALPQADRDVLLLHAWDELSHADIAAALGVEIGTVKSRLSRARARLRELLEPSGQVVSDG